MKITGDLQLPDDPAKADRFKKRTDDLFNCCVEVAKAKLTTHNLKLSYLAKTIEDDRAAVQKLVALTVRENLTAGRIERYGKQLRDYEERKQTLEMTRDAPLFNIDVIAPPTTTNLKINSVERVELADVKDLRFTTAKGKEVLKEEALKALAKGGLVVVSTDGRAVSSKFLKLLKDDVLVLVSPEFVGVGGAKNK